jgi:hypothetical protein
MASIGPAGRRLAIAHDRGDVGQASEITVFGAVRPPEWHETVAAHTS